MPAAEGRAAGAARQGLIDRHDLVATLDRAAGNRVTIISAPAGSGKTSLLRAWADRPGRDRRIAFMSVQPGQHDAQLFWLALLRAVRAATGDAEPPSAAPGFNGQAMVDKVRSELAAPGSPFVLIIDDLHELSSAEAAEQLTALLTSLPPGVHAVVATRRDPPLRLHRLRLAGELAEIRAAQLRFTQDETRELLTAAGITLPDPVVATLHQRTEGWAAGLRLAVLSLAGHPHPERFVTEFSGSDRTVAEYLMAEMLDRQPPEVRRLLLRTSLLDRVNGELADLLTGATGSERILLDLEDANAFVVSLDPGRTWFRYHHMFRGLLRLELRRTLPGDIPELHRLAARWFADHAQTADAIRHLQAAGDWTEAARLLTDHALSLTLDGQAGTVAALLRAFPARTGEDFPGLALVHAIADLDQLRLDQADAHLDVARAYAAAHPARPAVPAADGHRVAGPAVGAAARALRRRFRAGGRADLPGRRPVQRGRGPRQRPARCRAAEPRRHRGVVAAAGRQRTVPAGRRRPRPRDRPAVPGSGLPRPPGVRRHRPLLRPGPAVLRGRHSAGGPARLGHRTGDRPRAGDTRLDPHLDGRVRPRRTVAGPRQARHRRPGASRASSCSST